MSKWKGGHHRGSGFDGVPDTSAGEDSPLRGDVRCPTWWNATADWSLLRAPSVLRCLEQSLYGAAVAVVLWKVSFSPFAFVPRRCALSWAGQGQMVGFLTRSATASQIMESVQRYRHSSKAISWSGTTRASIRKVIRNA